jgi:hypothetical protein
MWILLWMQLGVNGIKYYHVDTYQKETDCITELSKAQVMVSNERENMACLYIATK